MSQKVSIIIPIYNVEKYLNRCLESVVNQSYINLEIILVDDGSKDASSEICELWAKKDSRIRLIKKQNGGLSDARNAGTKVAAGEFVFYLDSDDYIRSDAIELLVAEMNISSADMVICNYEYITDDGIVIHKNSPIKDEMLNTQQIINKLHEMNWPYYVTAWNKLYKKEIISQIEFPVGRIHEDLYVAHKVFAKCRYISVVNQKLYYYVQRNNSIMSTSVSAAHFDAVDAMIKRYWFYIDNGYKFEFQDVFDQMNFEKKYYLKQIGRLFDSDVKKRLLEINRQFRKILIDRNGLFSMKTIGMVKYTYIGDLTRFYMEKMAFRHKLSALKKLFIS